MAVIEIAKIQVRRGQENQTGIPALAGGEFAWAADTERLFIGLRRDDGGSRDANVEILTENHLKNFFQVSFTTSTYIYREGSVSAVAGIDGITEYGGAEWQRTIQDKLDDIVSVKDFGVYGNGNDWDLDRLQFTIDRLFLNSAKYSVDPAKKLYFPAGTYYITGTVHIPAYATIIGDGIGKTVFVLTTNTSAMFKTMDLRSPNGSLTGAITFDSGGFRSTGTAKFVQMSDLTLQYGISATITESMSLLSLDCADNSLIKNVEFKGNHTTGTGVLTTSGYVGLNLRGKTIDGTHANSIIDNCSFNGLYSGVLSNHDIKTITIQNSEFNTLVRGVTFNDPKDGTALVGPTFIKIANNRFDFVEQEAIYVGNNVSNTGSYVISQNNFFERVGTYYGEPDIGTATTAVITFLSDQNSSVNDHFRRALVHKNYINTPTPVYYKPLVNGRTTLDEVFVTTATIYPGNTATVFLRLPITGNSQHLNIKYSAFKQNAGASTGTVSTGTVGGTSVSLVDVTGIEVNSTVEISVASTVTSVIPVDTIIDAIDLNTNVITFSNTVTLAATDILVFTSQLDRMGNLGVYLQDSTSPNVLVTDDYNYINSDGGLVFSVSVNTTGTYYEISASLNTNTSFGTVVAAPIVLEFQNKLMI